MFKVSEVPDGLVWWSKKSKKWIFSNPAENLMTRCHSSSKTRDHAKFLENRNFLPLMGTKSILFGIFFLFFRSLPNFDMNYSLECQKNTGPVNLLSLLEKTLLSLKCEFWPIFCLKIGQNSAFKLNNFLCGKVKLFVDHACFFSFQVLLYVKFYCRSDA